MESKEKRVSVYLKTGRKGATPYYRFYQYFERMDGVFKYRKMLSDVMYDKFMPISQKDIITKILIYIYILIIRTIQLTGDIFWHPQYIIISRCFINKYVPFWIKLQLLLIRKRGGRIIWDFDDDIIAGGEICRKEFDWLGTISSTIIVGNPYLKSLLKTPLQSQTRYMPTTDGDLAALSNPLIEKKRIQLLRDDVRLIWVGSFSGLGFIKYIWDDLEECATSLAQRRLVLTIVADGKVEYCPRNFTLRQITWTRDRAIREMETSHIGIMPLEDSVATRGKCGFKLIQYLAAALPIIGSDVGINHEIICKEVGCSIKSHEKMEWSRAILALTKSDTIWQKYSRAAFDRWKKNYHSDSNLTMWNKLLNSH